MKNYFLLGMLFFTVLSHAQDKEKGAIVGKISDKQMQGEPLPFANVIIKGTTNGATTDFDGLYALDGLEPGSYTVVYSFVGYETLEIPNVEVKPGEVTEINPELGPDAAALDEVVITTVARKDSEIALLLEQKGAIEIKGSIGAQELAKLGVSNVAQATTKISGVSSSEGSGDIYVRGLGDRYFYTTMNGLPIPSDDVERKNIDLGLFSTSVIQDVSISKTYSAESSADQASGTIDISTREQVGPATLNIGAEVGVNSNVLEDGVWDNFRITANSKDISAGIYSQELSAADAITGQSWNTRRMETPLNYKFSLTAGKRFGDSFNVLFTGSQSAAFEHSKGAYRQFRSNFLEDEITDAEEFTQTYNTTGLLDLGYEISENHSLRATSLFVNKLTDEVYEGGRNGEGVVFEETNAGENLSQFVRDQNTKQTRLWVNQLAGEHKLGDRNLLNWAVGYNMVDAEEPNRIRNEVNFNDDLVQLGRMGGFQQRKSSQRIDDRELNAMIKDKLVFSDTLDSQIFLSFGGNFRNKERDFQSQFFGIKETTINTVHPASIDDLTSVFTESNISSGRMMRMEQAADLYLGSLNSAAGFANFNYGIEKWNINLGVRYQFDELIVDYNVGNIPGRIGKSEISYNNFYPALNVRYAVDDNHNLRISGSRTISLPEFKEIAPFEYVSQTGQITRGNPNLEASTNYNLDLKWEFFPTSAQLISLTGFYKKIEDPINKVQDRGSAGVYSFFNSGEEANIYGIEAEARLDLTPSPDAEFDLALNLNATRMWHKQDLKEERNAENVFLRTFRYKGLTETGLQGASDWIFNGSLNFETQSDNPFMATLTATYASDKIYALGAPEIQSMSETHYNDAIMEEGFVTLDAVLGKDFGDHWSLKLTGENLLNPEIKRTQLVRPSTTGIETKETVRSYSLGSGLSLGVSYKF